MYVRTCINRADSECTLPSFSPSRYNNRTSSAPMRYENGIDCIFSPKQATGRIARKSHIEAIPPEILLLIFEAYCCKSPPVEDSTPREFTLTHVCQYWRSLALDCSALWANPSITFKTPLPIALTYIHRSRDVPLELDVDLRCDPTSGKEQENVLALWEAINSESHRWRRLSIKLGPQTESAFADDLPNLETPLLEDLRMTSESTEALSLRPFNRTPFLRILRLRGVTIMPFTPSLGQITCLHLCGQFPMSISNFREVMVQMFQLTELQLCDRVARGWPTNPSQEDIITLPALTILKLADQRWPLFIPLLSIKAPLLHSLSLCDLVAHDLPETLREKEISSQYPSLRKLIITGRSSFVDEVAFTQLARSFPKVDHFALLYVDPFFVIETCQNLHEPSLMPMLQTLSMIPVVAENILCSLITMRKSTVKNTGLKRLVVPARAQFNEQKWISERVRIEKC